MSGRLIGFAVGTTVILVMSSGCSQQSDISSESDRTAPEKVEVEFIIGEKTQKELDALGIEWSETNAIQPQDKTGEKTQ